MINKVILLLSVTLTSLVAAGMSDFDKVGPLGAHYGYLGSINEKYFPENIKSFNVTHAEKGNYQVFVNVLGSIKISNIVEKKEIFFGTNEEYFEKMQEEIKALQLASQSGMGAVQSLQAMPNALLGSGTDLLKGAGLGVVLNPIFNMIGDYQAKKERGPEYYLVTMIKDSTGRESKVTSLFVCDKKQYSMEEIKNLIINKQKEKGIK